MSGYTKLFNSILASTVWNCSNTTRIVWITLLAMADRYGVVECSIPGLAVLARVDRDACERALVELASPDPDSRSKVDEGRRVNPVPGGYRLVNHSQYRSKLSVDDRREYLRVKQAEHRARKRLKASSKASTTSHQKSTKSTQAAPTPDATPRTPSELVPMSVLDPDNQLASTVTNQLDSKTDLDPLARAKQNLKRKHPELTTHGRKLPRFR